MKNVISTGVNKRQDTTIRDLLILWSNLELERAPAI